MESNGIPLSDLIDDVAALDEAEAARANAAREERAALLKEITAKIRSGETTGDIARDFVICCGAGGTETQRDFMLKRLREVQAAVAACPNELAIIVVMEQSPFGGRSGCVVAPSVTTHAYLAGVLNGPSIILDVEHASWKLPTARHVSWKPGAAAFTVEGPLTADPMDMLAWYGIGHHDHSPSVEMLIGNKAVDEWFAKQFKHEHLAALVDRLSLSMPEFPKNAERTERHKKT